MRPGVVLCELRVRRPCRRAAAVRRGCEQGAAGCEQGAASSTPSRPDLMKEVIREAIRGHQRPSEAIRGHQRPSAVIRGHQRSSEAIRGSYHHPSASQPMQLMQPGAGGVK